MAGGWRARVAGGGSGRRVAGDDICNLYLMTKFLTPIVLGFVMWRVDGGLAAGGGR